MLLSVLLEDGLVDGGAVLGVTVGNRGEGVHRGGAHRLKCRTVSGLRNVGAGSPG